MKLKIGLRYRMRNGWWCTIVGYMVHLQPYPWKGMVHRVNFVEGVKLTSVEEWWADNGRYNLGKENHEYDLVQCLTEADPE